jgi:hypothetical protein
MVFHSLPHRHSYSSNPKNLRLLKRAAHSIPFVLGANHLAVFKRVRANWKPSYWETSEFTKQWDQATKSPEEQCAHVWHILGCLVRPQCCQQSWFDHIVKIQDGGERSYFKKVKSDMFWMFNNLFKQTVIWFKNNLTNKPCFKSFQSTFERYFVSKYTRMLYYNLCQKLWDSCRNFIQFERNSAPCSPSSMLDRQKPDDGLRGTNIETGGGGRVGKMYQ